MDLNFKLQSKCRMHRNQNLSLMFEKNDLKNISMIIYNAFNLAEVKLQPMGPVYFVIEKMYEECCIGVRVQLD